MSNGRSNISIAKAGRSLVIHGLASAGEWTGRNKTNQVNGLVYFGRMLDKHRFAAAF
jgi:hypothetical protein